MAVFNDRPVKLDTAGGSPGRGVSGQPLSAAVHNTAWGPSGPHPQALPHGPGGTRPRVLAQTACGVGSPGGRGSRNAADTRPGTTSSLSTEDTHTRTHTRALYVCQGCSPRTHSKHSSGGEVSGDAASFGTDGGREEKHAKTIRAGSASSQPGRTAGPPLPRGSRRRERGALGWGGGGEV